MQSDPFLAQIVPGVAFHQDSGMLFSLMNFSCPRWNTDSVDDLLRKAPLSCEQFSDQQGIYIWKSYMSRGKHLIKRMTTWSAAVIYVHSFLIKKRVLRPIFFIFIAAQHDSFNCSCLTFWLSLFCFEKRKTKTSTFCFRYWADCCVKSAVKTPFYTERS